MPSHTPKQRRVMSAIAHGWRPDNLDIPVKVAKEFHAADAGHKYGKGHHLHHKAQGGALNLAYALKRAEGGEVHVGPIVSTVPGRTDRHEMDVGSGSYILPAEAISHLGENNTLAGLAKLKEMGAHGLRRLVHKAQGASAIIRKHRAKGGAANSSEVGRPIGIIAAGGEYTLSPQEVSIIGDGDVTLGHRLLDNWIMENRRDHIKTLTKLKPPAKD